MVTEDRIERLETTRKLLGERFGGTVRSVAVEANLRGTSVSSAEMTAVWRSSTAKISLDALSGALSSQDGRNLAGVFRDDVYPLIERHLTVRARFFLENGVGLMRHGNFDACISLGSGLSMLTTGIHSRVMQDRRGDAPYFVDADVPRMIALRRERLRVSGRGTRALEHVSLDLEECARQRKRLRNIVPRAKHPIFVLEGLIYFLSRACVEWLFEEIRSYSDAAVIVDYWPSQAPILSSTFRRMIDFFERPQVVENVRGLISESDWSNLLVGWSILCDQDVATVERGFVTEVLLTDPEAFVPARFLVAASSRAQLPTWPPNVTRPTTAHPMGAAGAAVSASVTVGNS
jgi:hypothetical protein